MIALTKEYNSVLVPLSISRKQFMKYYTGKANSITAKSMDGRRIQFPATNLRKFMTAEGISGTFRLTYDANGKLIELIKCD